MKIICLVLDSFGIGNAPDAEKFGDYGSNTYKAIADSIYIPNLRLLGLNNIDSIDFAASCVAPLASYGRLVEKSCGKDTTTGHFEMMQIITDKPFPTFPNGFPASVIDMLKKAWGVNEIIGNIAASGTAIINELGQLHREQNAPIVYTSADSVLQVACDEEIFPLEKLYEMCSIARKLLTGDSCVARVIARPFRKNLDNTFYRTEGRKDYGITPSGESTLKKLQKMNVQTIGVGKIFDIFSGDGIDKNIVAHSNEEVINATLKQMKTLNSCKSNNSFLNLSNSSSSNSYSNNNAYIDSNENQHFDKIAIKNSESQHSDKSTLCIDEKNSPSQSVFSNSESQHSDKRTLCIDEKNSPSQSVFSNNESQHSDKRTLCIDEKNSPSQSVFSNSEKLYSNKNDIKNNEKQYPNYFIFSNLVEFDMLYGHRNDVNGYKTCLESFDRRLPDFLKDLNFDDYLIITADHGCDPSTPSTDHSRECVPLLIYSESLPHRNLGTIFGFDYIGKFIEDTFKNI